MSEYEEVAEVIEKALPWTKEQLAKEMKASKMWGALLNSVTEPFGYKFKYGFITKAELEKTEDLVKVEFKIVVLSKKITPEAEKDIQEINTQKRPYIIAFTVW